uniref:Radial spokehead-like protein n=1 Tax=Percolomonas cosmopolitus TaxID=63605 RepID=A0A7S1KN70_9EUKA|mmetsp:Transcript_1397/g.4794  ORF Transcript_1397/g.4794 Transcript_1397/m.4794 type:complete len:557 (+) Transcript_1397:49-1719(+)
MSANTLSFQPLHNPTPLSQCLETTLTKLAYLADSKLQRNDLELLFYVLLSQQESKTSDQYENILKKLQESDYAGLSVAEGASLESTTWVESLLKLIKPPVPEKKAPELDEDGNPIEEEEEEEAEEEGKAKPALSAVLTESQQLRLFGLGLSEVEVGALHVALVRFAESAGSKFSTIRFFGKLFGTLKNYYVLECEMAAADDEEEEPEEDEEEEQKKEKPDPSIVPPDAQGKPGTNRYVYFVTNALDSNQWDQLPEVDPSHIKYARQIRQFITGVLDSPIESHPPFPGTEREYLRAQIARISSATAIAPKGLMKILSDDDEEEEEEDGPKKPEPEVVPVDAYKQIPTLAKNSKFAPDELDFTSLDAWTHVLPSILHTQDRAQLYVPPKEGEEEEEEEEEDEDAPKKPKEPVEQILPLLAPLSKEAPIKSFNTNLPGWSIQQCSEDKNTVLVQSLRWPGAYSVARFEKDQGTVTFSNIYLGEGLKFTSEYTPTFVAPVEEEFHEFELVEENDPSPEEAAKFEVIPPKPQPVEETGEGEEAGEGEEKGEGDEEEEDDEE